MTRSADSIECPDCGEEMFRFHLEDGYHQCGGKGNYPRVTRLELLRRNLIPLTLVSMVLLFVFVWIPTVIYALWTVITGD